MSYLTEALNQLHELNEGIILTASNIPNIKYYPQILKDFLKKVETSGIGLKDFRGNQFFDVNTPTIKEYYTLGFISVNKNAKCSELDAETVGEEILLTFFQIDMSGKKLGNIMMTMKEFLNKEEWDFFSEDDSFQSIIDLYKEAKTNVEEAEKNIAEKEKRAGMTPLERQSYSMKQTRYFPLSEDTVKWFREHTKRITIRVKRALINELKAKFPNSEYIQNDKYGILVDEAYSWSANFTFDDPYSCPDQRIIDLLASDGTLSNIAIAETLYNNFGFDFGVQ